MNKMLVLTALTCPEGYSKHIYHTFAGSLAGTGFNGDIIIMVTKNNFDELNLVQLEEIYPCLRFHTIPNLKEHRDINCYRYHFYNEYLNTRADEYEYVMLSDSRDVIFQRDISEYPFDPRVDLFFAEEEKLIKDCGINSGWILDLFGSETLEELKNNVVLCSGTTVGRTYAITRYLAMMANYVTNVEDQFHHRFGYLGGIDQGIHNYIYYKNLLPELTIKTMHNNENLFYTIGHVANDDKNRQFFNDESQFINTDGQLCYCIHQFDRLSDSVLGRKNRELSSPAAEQKDAGAEKSAAKASLIAQSAPLKIHLWDDTTHYKQRELLYNQEGWSTHPNTTLVVSPKDADITVWITTMATVEKEVPPIDQPNVIVLDYADGCTIHPERHNLKHEIGYFKRSFVLRENGIFVRNCTDDASVLPLAYSGADALIHRPSSCERTVGITNVLRKEGFHNINRKKIVEWTEEFVKTRSIENTSFVGEVSTGHSGSKWDKKFLNHLGNSRIVVTCNPNDWEGDFRLWEAMLSGALVFVDCMVIPDLMPYPFQDKMHWIVYDPDNKIEFDALLEHYWSHPDEAELIAEAGYKYTLAHHMPKDRVSYILQSVGARLKPVQ
jgi:hypothetical protein